jgi:hypothetical protein
MSIIKVEEQQQWVWGQGWWLLLLLLLLFVVLGERRASFEVNPHRFVPIHLVFAHIKLSTPL